jgi:hypothetical protein
MLYVSTHESFLHESAAYVVMSLFGRCLSHQPLAELPQPGTQICVM